MRLYRFFVPLLGVLGTLAVFAASVSPEDAGSNLSAWAAWSGMEDVPSWLASSTADSIGFVVGTLLIVIALGIFAVQLRKYYKQLAKLRRDITPGHWVHMTTEEKNHLRTRLAQLSPKKGRILFKPNYDCDNIADSLRDCFNSIKWDVDSDGTLFWTPDEGICIIAPNELSLFLLEAIESSLGNKSGIKVDIKTPDQNVDFIIIIGKQPT